MKRILCIAGLLIALINTVLSLGLMWYGDYPQATYCLVWVVIGDMMFERNK